MQSPTENQALYASATYDKEQCFQDQKEQAGRILHFANFCQFLDFSTSIQNQGLPLIIYYYFLIRANKKVMMPEIPRYSIFIIPETTLVVSRHTHPRISFLIHAS